MELDGVDYTVDFGRWRVDQWALFVLQRSQPLPHQIPNTTHASCALASLPIACVFMRSLSLSHCGGSLSPRAALPLGALQTLLSITSLKKRLN